MNYLTAQEAARELNITLPTLYAYVSRGLIRSEETPGKSRTKRYRAEDVAALKARKALRHNPAQAAETALHWGMPVLESSLTLIENGRFFYRGHDALELAARATLEEVAVLLWHEQPGFSEHYPVIARQYAAFSEQLLPQELVAGLSPVAAFQMVLPLAAKSDLAAYDLSAAAVAQTGARILLLLATVAAGRPVETTIAHTLQQAWLPQLPWAADWLNMALVLCADHELNISSFTARCVASAGATPYGVVTAGLAALQGSKHGGHTERVEALLREAEHGAETAVVSRLRRGESIPGFGHRLYPAGDPRGRLLLDTVQARSGNEPVVTLAQAVETAVSQTTGQLPTIDLGLVVMTQVLGLPPGTALTLFALGRTVGWVGHAIEQYALDQLIRPRARYVGWVAQE
jgi:citrate synthase